MPPKKKSSNRTRILLRYIITSAAILLFAGIIAVNVFRTTVINADKWNSKARQELSRIDTIMPERGDILAADGSVLATNLRYYTLRIDFQSERFMFARYTNAIDSMADSLQHYFPIKGGVKAWADSLRAPLKREKKSRSWRLLRNITYADYMRVKTFPFFNIKNPNRNGLIKEDRLRRRNPYGDMARRSIGVVYERYYDKQSHGFSGLEKALDSLLYGVPGVYKKLPLTKDIVNWTDVPAKRGYDILTTIDINMQDIVENELNNMLEFCAADWGVAILMEVSTGDIKAISNLERNPYGPGYVEGMNRAVRGFEPGSVVKTLSMMVAIEDGLVHNLDSMIVTGTSFPYAGGIPIRDSHHTNAMPVREVLEQSSNIAMAKIITRAYGSHPSLWRERIARMGFLDRLGSGIAEELPPYFPKVKDDRGGRITLSRMSYGYATEIPPLHTLSIYNAIANGGRYVRPRLIKGLKNDDIDSILPVSYIRDRICSEKTAATMRELLKRVVWGEHGTARVLRNDMVSIAGKTGTCWMIDTLTHRYNKAHKRLAFCGFFPADAPLYSCMVLTAHPRQNAMGAPSTSGVILKNIALKMYSRGMLNNVSDYHADSPNDKTHPTLYATHSTGRNDRISQGLDITNAKHLKTPQKTNGGTAPNVIGLGLREAVACIENAGYNVSFSGSGYVAGQSPPAGTHLPRGARINITLHE
jgi:cell division protein FtsI (penicillin-binding protein 3)